MKKLSFITLATFAIVGVACAPPTAHESAEIRARADAWETAFQAQDLDGLIALYSDDARVMAPNMPIERGHEAIEAVFGGMFDAGLGGELQSAETMAVGDLGYHIGTFTLEADGTVVDRGKFIEVWRKVDGQWKISADMFSSDLPAPGGEGGATLIGTHEVEDAANWLAAWQGEDSRHGLFAQHGVSSVRVFQSQENPNLTGLVINVADMDAFQEFMESDEVQAAKAADGVKDDTLRILAEVQ